MTGKFPAEEDSPNTKKADPDNSVLEFSTDKKNDVLELPEFNSDDSNTLRSNEDASALKEQIENLSVSAALISTQTAETDKSTSFNSIPSELENLPPIGQKNPTQENYKIGESRPADNSAIEEEIIAPPMMSAAAEIEAGLDNAAPVEDLPQTSFEFAAFSTAPQKEAVDYTEELGSGETVRRSGLAWSAGIVFFGSIAFMLTIGWFADLLLGSKPWGIVGGIVLGSIIGFIQFFRISSQIFNKSDSSKLDL